MKRFAFFAALLLGAVGLTLVLTTGPGAEKLAAAGSPLSFAAQGFRSADYDLTRLAYYQEALVRVRDDYVDPGRVDPRAMLEASLSSVARVVPEFLFELEDAQLDLVMGSDSTRVYLPSVDSLPDLRDVTLQVASFVGEHLPETVEPEYVEYALMNGMLSTLDPHSVYIDPDSYGEMHIKNQGHFGGLGITIGIRENRLTILYPLKGTPAAEAGLKAGDRIDRIGSESTVNMTLQEAVQKLRGEIGTDVLIRVSDDDGMDREVTIERARIEVPSVEHAYAGDGVGLVQLTHFTQETHQKLEDALDELEQDALSDGHKGLQGVVLDLRQNPGGYLAEAIKVADKFLRNGVIVSTDMLAKRNKDVRRASKFGTEDKLPLVVLVDEGSASASEIVAGALKNHNRAALLGVRTFGKGSVQNLYERDFNDGALKLTIAQYLTPGDVSIQGQGVLPDIELRPALVKSDAEDGTVVQMYWQDFELREEDLDNPFAWGNNEDRGAVYKAIYACPECWEPRDSDRETGAVDHLDDLEVRAAKALLLAAPQPTRQGVLDVAPMVLEDLLQQREEQLYGQLADLGIDWSPAPKDAVAEQPRISVEMSVDSETSMLRPGKATPVRLTVRNDGERSVHRLRAVSNGDFFRGHEYFFGALEPGQQKSFSVEARPSTWLTPRTAEVEWHFFSDGNPTATTYVDRLRVEEVKHPRFAFAAQVIDDGSGESRGNGDGLIQPGETIDLLVTVKNIGEGATSDRWPGEDGDEPNGYVSLKNRSEEALFLVEGTSQFSLDPGEQSEHRLNFRVAEDVGTRTELDLDLRVGDARAWELVSSELDLPIYSASEPIAAVDKRMRVKKGPVELRGGASERSAVVGTLDGVVHVEGRLGDWVRVQTGWGAPAWAPAASLAPVGQRADLGEGPSRVLSHSPPVVVVANNPGGDVVIGDKLVIEGEILDDRGVKDLFVFLRSDNGGRERTRKVRYERIDDRTGKHPFQLELKLAPGTNEIEIYARDEQDHQGKLSFGVFREAATAELSAPPPDSAVR